MITKIKIKNFQLFKETEITFGKINLITGINLDDPKLSGNGAAKTTILNAILFAKYGSVAKLNLTDLIRIGTKESIVELEEVIGNNKIRIVRKIPSSLEIYLNDNPKPEPFNTPTIAQKYLDDLYGNEKDFQMYRMFDNIKGINLLDLGIVTLRKNLIQFVDDYFSKKRIELLAQKNDKELHSSEKRPYRFYLSKKRLDTLKKYEIELNKQLSEAQQIKANQSELINRLKLKKNSLINHSDILKENLKGFLTKINSLETEIKNQKLEIVKLKNIVFKELIPVNYDSEIKHAESELFTIEEQINNTQFDKEAENENYNSIKSEINVVNTNIKNIQSSVLKLKQEASDVSQAKVGAKCNKCGSLISDNNKNEYIQEKLTEVDYSESQIKEYNESLNELNKKSQESQIRTKQLDALFTTLKTKQTIIQASIKTLTDKKFTQEKLIQENKSAKANTDAEIKRCTGLIDTYNKELTEINNSIAASNETNKTNEIEIKKIEEDLIVEEDIYNNEIKEYDLLDKKLLKAKNYIMKLTEAFKFSEYKYTKTDIQNYTDAIKVLDIFSAEYIQEWLNNLEIILNDLLRELNISVQFSADKSFMEVNNNGQKLKYEQLSSGQRVFLNSVFKLAILANNGLHDGQILVDEGANNMDIINLNKLIDIIKTLNYQVCLIYQNVNKDIEDTNYIEVQRENGESKIA